MSIEAMKRALQWMETMAHADKIDYNGQTPFKSEPLYTHPPRQWVGLSEEEINKCRGYDPTGGTWLEAARRIEAKLREKNSVGGMTC